MKQATSEPIGGVSKAVITSSSNTPLTNSSNNPSLSSLPQATLANPSLSTLVGSNRGAGLRGGKTTMKPPAWKAGAGPAISAAGPIPVGAGPRPVPRNEAVVLRKFPSDNVNGQQQQQPDKRQRTGSDSDAMALLRLASTGGSGNSLPDVGKDGNSGAGGGSAERRQGGQNPGAAGGGDPKDDANNNDGKGDKNNHELRSLQQELQQRSVAVDYAVGLALRKHVLLPLLKDFQSFGSDDKEDEEKIRQLSELQVVRLLGQYARGELVLMERPLKECSKPGDEEKGEISVKVEDSENGDKVAAAEPLSDADKKSDEAEASKECKDDNAKNGKTDDKDTEETAKVKEEENSNGEEKKEETKPTTTEETTEATTTAKEQQQQEKEEETSSSSSILSASIQLVDKDDAKTLASWYDSDGDKVLPDTSAEWSDWWKYRCGNPDPGCEMAKLVIEEDLLLEDAEKKMNGSGETQKKENILGVVYYERNILDRYPKTTPKTEDGEKPKRDNETTDDEKKTAQEKDGKNKEKDSASSKDDEKEKDQKDAIYTTLLRGIRVNPHINREVARRLSLTKSTDKLPDRTQYGNTVTKTLLQYVLYRALLCGAKCLGVTSAKSEVAEDFYDGIFGLPLCIRDEDGRRFYRMEGSQRWQVLRDGVMDQAKLWMKWDQIPRQDDDNDEEEVKKEDEPKEEEKDKEDKKTDTDEVMEDAPPSTLPEKGDKDEKTTENVPTSTSVAETGKEENKPENDDGKLSSSQFESAPQDMEIDKKEDEDVKDDDKNKKRALETGKEDKTTDSPSSPAAKKSRVEEKKDGSSGKKDDSKEDDPSSPSTSNIKKEEEEESSSGNDKEKVEMKEV